MRFAPRPLPVLRLLKAAALVLSMAGLAGCTSLPEPWEKGVLARPEMGFELDGLEDRFGDHTYASKEAAAGGGGVGGAGCGCN